MSSASMCGRQQFDGTRAAAHKNGCFFKKGNRCFGLALEDQSKAKLPHSPCIVRMDFYLAAQFTDCLVVTAGMEENPTDTGAGNSQWVKLAGTMSPVEGLIHASLTHQPLS